MAQDNFISEIYKILGGPIVFLSRKRTFEIADKIIADHREIVECFREEIATIEQKSKEEIDTIEKKSKKEIDTIEKNSREMAATIVARVKKKSREEVAMIEEKLQVTNYKSFIM